MCNTVLFNAMSPCMVGNPLFSQTTFTCRESQGSADATNMRTQCKILSVRCQGSTNLHEQQNSPNRRILGQGRTCQMNSTRATDRVELAACSTVTCTSPPFPDPLPSLRSAGQCAAPPSASGTHACAAASFTSACALLRGGPVSSHTMAPDAVATCSFLMSACTAHAPSAAVQHVYWCTYAARAWACTDLAMAQTVHACMQTRAHEHTVSISIMHVCPAASSKRDALLGHQSGLLCSKRGSVLWQLLLTRAERVLQGPLPLQRHYSQSCVHMLLPACMHVPA